MAIRTILLDIDGTLTNSKKKITKKTRHALIQAQKHGIMLVLASGRPEKGLERFAKELEMDLYGGLLCCYNGARIVDQKSKEVLFDQALTVEEGKAVLSHLKNFSVVPMVAKGDYMYVPNVFNNTIIYKGKPFGVMEYEARGNGFLLAEAADMEDFCDFPIHKILTFGEPEYLKANFEAMRAPFKGKVNSMFTADFYYEYTAMGIDKAKALATAFERLGIERDEIMAFGDAENDITMLMYAGIGVAMGNASQACKEAADEVTASNDEDGIYESLLKHMPEIF